MNTHQLSDSTTRGPIVNTATHLSFLIIWIGLFAADATVASDYEAITTAIKRLDRQEGDYPAAAQAIEQLSTAQAADIPALLKLMNDANALAVNWIRPVVERAAEQGEFPTQQVHGFLLDRDNAPKARRLAYELLLDRDPSIQALLVTEMLDDPSLEMRWDAVEMVLAEVKQTDADTEKKQLLRKALEAARNPDQIETIAKQLDELGEKVDLVDQFGFQMVWQLVGPFDHTGSKAFHTEYGPEKELDLSANYEGKEGQISWAAYTSESSDGQVDLTEAIGKHKGAIAYAYGEFNADKAQKVDVRLGTPNAYKVWINGDLIMDSTVYHAGSMIDQYIGQADLRAGTNTMLIKVCQNEQTEPWAQDWTFQLRLTDDTGKAIKPAEPIAAQ